MAESAEQKKRLVLAQHGNVVSVVGAVDLANVDLLLARLLWLREEYPTVVVDLGGVTYMDSTGFGALLRACRELRHRGGQLILRQPADHIRRMLEITGMLRFFDLE